MFRHRRFLRVHDSMDFSLMDEAQKKTERQFDPSPKYRRWLQPSENNLLFPRKNISGRNGDSTLFLRLLVGFHNASFFLPRNRARKSRIASELLVTKLKSKERCLETPQIKLNVD
jgi:hypothetical protein